MGLRGPGAKPIKKNNQLEESVDIAPPWEADGLSRLERVISFLEVLPITSGSHAGRPFKVRDWQREILASIYTETDGIRLVRTAVISMSRKNGKTDLAARLALCHLAGPEAEPRGEVFSAANDRFQASRTFKEMAAIVEQVAWLADRISIRRHAKEMEDIGGTGSTFAALSSDVATKHGLSPSFVVYDELGQAPNRDLYDALNTAMGARAEPLMVVISTQAASDIAPLSGLIDYGLKVQSGDIVDPSFLLAFFTAAQDLDPWDPATWALANPALGDFRSLEDVQRMASQAQTMPASESAFRNLILNQRVSSVDSFMSEAAWKMCGGELQTLDKRPCFAGLDLGGARDLTALVMVFVQDDGTYDAVPIVWVPGDLKQREHDERAPYPLWHKQGHLRSTGEKTTNPALIARDVAELVGKYDIKQIAFDRWKIDDLKRELDIIGCEVELVPHGQGFKDFSPAVDLVERVIAEGIIRHANHPVLAMCASNAVVVRDPAGGRKLEKAKSRGRIDAVVALAMALTVATRHVPEEEWTPFCMIG
jgi:phage terminase large subunit-like protein